MLDVRLNQTEADAHFGVAEYLQNKGDPVAALNEFQRALDLDSNHREAAYRLGALLLLNGGGEQANAIFEKGLADRSPEEVTDLCGNLALDCFGANRHAEAAFLLRRALQASPGQAAASNALAWLLATSYDEKVRNPVEALTLAEGNTGTPNKVIYLQTLAAAQATSEKFPEAIATIKQAIDVLSTNPHSPGNPDISILTGNLGNYEANEPIRTGSQR